MRKSYKIVVAILFSIFTFTLIIFLGTISTVLSKVESFNFQPTMFGQDIVYVHIQDNVFKANVPWTVVIIFGLLGGSIQLLINKFSKSYKQVYMTLNSRFHS
ncbi:hypothetical protein [Lysinibacillus sp. FJAT-14222]|uniref:hypothetical protein n=1 Tax=Lysinibacillus sp. FJAT-14222 TaxID=1932366 RepID=UPI0006AE579D|nr:hypothetical protein [Lysinibacillus sp. FJAT-14222]KOS63825.1 hypothetical protein AN161_04320 [Lysinibacillus sp. FJAT-14222]